VFWDELFVYPFLTFRVPEVTRSLLMYRYRRLGEARAAGTRGRFRGAMFPWQSGQRGTDETQTMHLNPLSGVWEPDLSHNQRHVNAAIFYNVWTTSKRRRTCRSCATTAPRCCSRSPLLGVHRQFNPARGRYEIHGVMGRRVPREVSGADVGAFATTPTRT